MKKTILFIFLIIATASTFAQRKITTSAIVKFDATTSINKLSKAENKTVIASINTRTGALAVEVAVKNFAFSSPTIQDHFNGSSWLNSDKYPTIIYKGNITDLHAVDFSKDGVYPVKTEGLLTIKGVEQKLVTPATITVRGNSILAVADFSIRLSDFGITGSTIDGGKVAKEPKINITAELK